MQGAFNVNNLFCSYTFDESTSITKGIPLFGKNYSGTVGKINFLIQHGHLNEVILQNIPFNLNSEENVINDSFACKIVNKFLDCLNDKKIDSNDCIKFIKELGSVKIIRNRGFHELFSEGEHKGFTQKDDPRFNLLLAECWYQEALKNTTNETLRISLFTKASNMGNGEAQNTLGLRYYSGNGVEKNLTKAHELFKMSADQNNPYGLYLLGCRYQEGDTVKKNEDLAQQLWMKAALLGDKSAIYNLAHFYKIEMKK